MVKDVCLVCEYRAHNCYCWNLLFTARQILQYLQGTTPFRKNKFSKLVYQRVLLQLWVKGLLYVLPKVDFSMFICIAIKTFVLSTTIVNIS